jgi:hypothetical protein
MLRIIDNKRVELTDAEYALFNSICEAYDQPPHVRGADLFKDLFETDNNGMIIFLRPPAGKRYISMEIYMFLVSVMVHQHLGFACKQVDSFISEGRGVIKEARQLVKKLKSVRK